MLSSFILNAELLPVDGFAGQIAQCHFSVADYHDDLFSAIGIGLPDHLASAVAKRKAEYLAGRYLARRVLAELGHQDFDLLRGEKREPLWPAGIAGAISHNVDTALCAAKPESGAGGVGIDVETQIPLARAEELWTGIVSEEECQWLRQRPQPFNLLLTLVFSAKESLFKALYPQVRCYFDFLDARIIGVDMQAQTFELELLTTLTPLCHAGRRFSGRFWQQGDAVTTFICF